MQPKNISTPNAETIKAIYDAENGKTVKVESVDELFDSLENKPQKQITLVSAGTHSDLF